MTTTANIATALGDKVALLGFEVLGAVSVGAYNEKLGPEHEGLRLPEVRDQRDLVLVVGNARLLWLRFLETYRTTASLRAEENPLDTYSRLHIGSAAARVATELGLRYAVRYSFDPAPEGVAISRLASLAGVGEASPVGLCVHSEYGPWFSLRAAVVFDVEGPAPSAARPTCSTCKPRPCVAARDAMLRHSGAAFDDATFLANWRAWLAMRDACPVGVTARYSEQQIRYHYLKDRSILEGTGRNWPQT